MVFSELNLFTRYSNASPFTPPMECQKVMEAPSAPALWEASVWDVPAWDVPVWEASAWDVPDWDSPAWDVPAWEPGSAAAPVSAAGAPHPASMDTASKAAT